MNYLDYGIELINKIEEMGYKAYLVGGAIRDSLLGLESNDIDIATSMPLELIEKTFKTKPNGKDFFSLTIIYKKYTFEITHFRKDIKSINHRHPEVSYCDTYEEDSKRRDLTINALAMDKNRQILDFHGGLDDLKAKTIKMIGNPVKRFDEDALRILRAIYYYAKLDFNLDKATEKALCATRELLVYLSDERLFANFKRIAYLDNDKGLKFIKDNNIFQFVPVYNNLLSIFDKNYKEEDLVFYYYLKFFEYFPLTSKEDKKLCKELDILINSNFGNYELYLYTKTYKRFKSLLSNLGYDTASIDKKLRQLVIKSEDDLELSKALMSKVIKTQKKQLYIDRTIKLILDKKINNTKEDITSVLDEKIKAYVDSFYAITILLDKDVYEINKDFYLEYDNKKSIRLDIFEFYEEDRFYKYVAKLPKNIKLNEEYYITDFKGNRGLLRSGSIIRTQEFENKFKYDGPLGFVYTKNSTKFYVWTPVAKQMVLELYHNDIIKKYNMVCDNNGVWSVEVLGDLEGYGYLFDVRVFEEFDQILDPYAISSAENHKYNYVVDKTKFYKMRYDKPKFSGRYTDSVIYEASIRDFTSYYSGHYLDLIKSQDFEGYPTGLEYIKSLGITHVQFLPTYDFYGVDDIDKDRFYNWGYNPLQYFVPSGWYS
ncbi:MAG: hypothetical protein K6E20_03400, partial [Acholeplasmatales bacterium]|nr:hypothetical protein [Acholeplasmatales bacterium]